MDRIGDEAAALAYPRTALFEPLGMTSAEMEADAPIETMDLRFAEGFDRHAFDQQDAEPLVHVAHEPLQSRTDRGQREIGLGGVEIGNPARLVVMERF